MTRISVYPNQSILDVALQHTGTIEQLFAVMSANNMTELPLDATDEFYIPTVIHTEVVTYYKSNTKQLASLSPDFYGAFSFGFSNGFN
jgi:hypothetical protein